MTSEPPRVAFTRALSGASTLSSYSAPSSPSRTVSSKVSRAFSSVMNPEAPTRRMTLAEEASLPPWEKWLRFRRFPVKMLLHLLLVGLVTAQIIAMNVQDAGQYRSFRDAWRKFFFPAGYDMSRSPFTRVYSIDDGETSSSSSSSHASCMHAALRMISDGVRSGQCWGTAKSAARHALTR